uniref:hypothetical protein n=1 Tax=Fulvivirga sp. TaxID=1931237 RepID=UPI00404B1B71
MKSYEKLDRTLEYLIEKGNAYGEKSKDIHNKLKIADSPLEQHLILEKLKEDNYVYALYEKNSETGEEVNKTNPSYLVSYHGVIFLENGGYEIEFTLMKREKLNRHILSVLNPAWKVLAFILLLGGIFKLGVEIFGR